MTEEEMLIFVKNNWPELVIKKAQVNDKGWDNDILIINQEWVYRFPKSNKLIFKLEDEGKILQLLKNKAPILRLPEYEYLFEEEKVKGVKYRFLTGQPLSECSVVDIRENPENAKRLGDFLSKLHSIPIADLEETNIGPFHILSYWIELCQKVERELFPFLEQLQQNEIREVFNSFIGNYHHLSYENSIIHGDLTLPNIIYDQKTESINGIIDFTDAQIGDPAFDFAGLYWAYGEDFTRDVLRWYNSNENKEQLMDRVKSFYGLQPIFHELLYAIEKNQKINWQTALNKFSALNQLAV